MEEDLRAQCLLPARGQPFHCSHGYKVTLGERNPFALSQPLCSGENLSAGTCWGKPVQNFLRDAKEPAVVPSPDSNGGFWKCHVGRASFCSEWLGSGRGRQALARGPREAQILGLESPGVPGGPPGGCQNLFIRGLETHGLITNLLWVQNRGSFPVSPFAPDVSSSVSSEINRINSTLHEKETQASFGSTALPRGPPPPLSWWT